MSKHTPGPWKARLKLDAKNGQFSAEITPWNAIGPSIAYVVRCQLLHGQAEANAHLIAASPIMYEALKVAVSEMRDWHPEHPSMAKILSAIAQAEGKS